MNEKLLEIYDECIKRNISISIKYLLSDAVIEIIGTTLFYNPVNKKYETLKCEKWVSIHGMRSVNGPDLVLLAIYEIFNQLINVKEKYKKGV